MLSASMAAMGLTGCGSDNVDGTKTAITVNDESITLGQANFMLRYQQATMYNYYSKMYSMYGMQMPSEMYDKEGDDGKTTGETFKEQSLDTIEKETSDAAARRGIRNFPDRRGKTAGERGCTGIRR